MNVFTIIISAASKFDNFFGLSLGKREKFSWKFSGLSIKRKVFPDLLHISGVNARPRYNQCHSLHIEHLLFCVRNILTYGATPKEETGFTSTCLSVILGAKTVLS